MRIYRRARRWIAYHRHLDHFIKEHMDLGYRVSSATMEVYRDTARQLARRDWP